VFLFTSWCTMRSMIHAKKSLGQNFLKDKKTISAVVTQASLDLPVLEVGPGKGALTVALLEAGHKVTAIEKDDRLIEFLEEKFETEIESAQLQIVHGDSLEVKPEDLGLKDGQYQIVTNLPYYITGIFLRTTLERTVRPTSVTLLLQREVIDRIVARDTKESILSISVKIFGDVRKVCNVPRKYFSPAPAVDSAVLHISNISDSNFDANNITIEQFFIVLRAGFANKRKTLANNLKELLQKNNKSFDQIVEEIKCDEKIRAEKLTVKQWIKITQLLTS